ncbi:MAG: hypothetical protein KFF49_06305 [Bacteroidales bacterium]|nr:hypothetical protein [Bacteroidales bacterium]
MNRFFSRKISVKLAIIPVAVLLLCLMQASVYAQADVQVSKEYMIKLKDGGTFTGKVLSQNAEQIVLETASMGTVTIQRYNIDEMRLLSSGDAMKGWYPNPNPSKYLIGSSAIAPEKGSGYYQNSWIFFNSFSYAFTDFFSITGGFEIFSLFAGPEGVYGFYLNPKASYEVMDNLHLGGNILYANTIRTVDEFGGLGTLNGFATYGNDNNNITASVGWGFAESEFSSKPLITISGMVRASKRIGFVSENWIIPNVGEEGSYYGLFSYGIRFLGENISFDLAFINNPDLAKVIYIGVPFLDFVFNF